MRYGYGRRAGMRLRRRDGSCRFLDPEDGGYVMGGYGRKDGSGGGKGLPNGGRRNRNVNPCKIGGPGGGRGGGRGKGKNR